MKTVLLAILGSLALTACASTAKYSSGDSTSQGVKLALGSADGIKAGDKLKALEKGLHVRRTIKRLSLHNSWLSNG